MLPARTSLKTSGVYRVRCDVHPHMGGYIVVLPPATQSAVTAADGSFAFDNLPAGEWHPRLWHVRANSQEVELHIHAGETVKVELALDLGAEHVGEDDHQDGDRDDDQHAGDGGQTEA